MSLSVALVLLLLWSDAYANRHSITVKALNSTAIEICLQWPHNPQSGLKHPFIISCKAESTYKIHTLTIRDGSISSACRDLSELQPQTTYKCYGVPGNQFEVEPRWVMTLPAVIPTPSQTEVTPTPTTSLGSAGPPKRVDSVHFIATFLVVLVVVLVVVVIVMLCWLGILWRRRARDQPDPDPIEPFPGPIEPFPDPCRSSGERNI